MTVPAAVRFHKSTTCGGISLSILALPAMQNRQRHVSILVVWVTFFVLALRCNIPDQQSRLTYRQQNPEQVESLRCRVFPSATLCLRLPLSELLSGPEALETAADPNWWYTLHQRGAAAAWCALAGAPSLPASEIHRAHAHTSARHQRLFLLSAPRRGTFRRYLQKRVMDMVILHLEGSWLQLFMF